MVKISLNIDALKKMSDDELLGRFSNKTTPSLDYILRRLNRKVKNPKKSKKDK